VNRENHEVSHLEQENQAQKQLGREILCPQCGGTGQCPECGGSCKIRIWLKKLIVIIITVY